MIRGNLRTERERAGLTLPELAERLGRSEKAVAGWEADMSGMPSSALSCAADVLGCTTDWLVGMEHPRTAL